MKSLFLRLRAMRAFARIHPHIDHAPEWTATDAKVLTTFLVSTPTGAKYRRIMWHHVQSCAFRAVVERTHATYECGYAGGARGIAAVSDSLLHVKTEEPAEKTEPTQQDDLDALRP